MFSRRCVVFSTNAVSRVTSSGFYLSICVFVIAYDVLISHAKVLLVMAWVEQCIPFNFALLKAQIWAKCQMPCRNHKGRLWVRNTFRVVPDLATGLGLIKTIQRRRLISGLLFAQ